jgi:hypothetical protein
MHETPIEKGRNLMNGIAAEIVAALTGEQWMAKDTSRTRPAPDQVARLAYRLYEARGRSDGHDIEDWLTAEARLTEGRVAEGLDFAVARPGTERSGTTRRATRACDPNIGTERQGRGA